ncbi:hypothetical protein [Leptospira noguchii]|uniref:Phage infection protein n=1 Tax=Leptospira noguchii TaxID=28182 RepID=A0AAE9GJI0_9LEPT|nr:hypothetical protein [Leptospira noguchii]UOG58796.1 hypothetical protein MAL03_20370 [Leptospira noguchii]
MKKLSVELENCYGIKKLNYTFNFEIKNVNAIYSPNGVMKTSFARTFGDVSKNVESKDIIFPEENTTRKITDESGTELNPESIFVIEPYNADYRSSKVSMLLVNLILKEEYEKINIRLEQKKLELIQSLKLLTGLKNGIEERISKVFTKAEDQFYAAISRVKGEVLDEREPFFQNIEYAKIFTDKTAKLLQTTELRTKLKEYILKYDELLSNSKFFKSGVFNHTNASTIAKNLKDNGFFRANHSVNFISKSERQEIHNEEQLVEIIDKEKQEILNNSDLIRIFNEIDKLISVNDEVRKFREYLQEHVEILPALIDIDAFEDKLWISYFKSSKEIFRSLTEEYETGKNKIEEIIEQARNEATSWSEVIDIFNQRFSVPFKLSVGNQDDVILKATAPIVQFEFQGSKISRTVTESDLMAVLSIGERRALYLLNIIFEVEARKRSKVKTIFVIDDIADSFDYKNKYAIVEYLKDISRNDFFYQIILSHNYDFFRTVSSRLDMKRENKLNSEKEETGIRIKPEHYQNNPFKHWKNNLHNDNSMLISSIPLVRNIAEYSGDDEVYSVLTSLLHYKEETEKLTIKNLEEIYKNILKDKTSLKLENPEGKVIDLIFVVANETLGKPNDELNLESKIVLSIAIRMKAEMYMVSKIDNVVFWKNITSNQANELLEKYKEKFSSEYDIIQILEQVNLMTPENIHLNSFMYEPILDMSNHHLKTLYKNVLGLK